MKAEDVQRRWERERLGNFARALAELGGRYEERVKALMEGLGASKDAAQAAMWRAKREVEWERENLKRLG